MRDRAVVRSERRSRLRVVGLVVGCLAVVAGTLAVSPLRADAQAAGVDLDTTFLRSGGPDAVGARSTVGLFIRNHGSAGATDAAVVLALPAGAQLLGSTPAGCAAADRTVTCPVGDLDAGSGTSFGIHLRFDQIGTFALTSSATADEPDADGDSSDRLELAVVEEEADLEVSGGSERALVGAVHRVRHFVHNRGPTNAGQVAIRGTFPEGAEVLTGTFALGGEAADETDELCDLTTTGFTCGPLPGIPASGAAEVHYDVVVPDEVGPIESTVTVVGRNDPDASNDTGTLVLEVGTPVADLYLDLLAYGLISGGQPYDATLWTWNLGDGPAEDVVATIEVPDGWLVDLPTDPDTRRSCEALAPHRVRCTADAIEADARWDLTVPVTPPSAGSGTGTIAAAVETPSPERATHPNTASAEIGYAPVGVDLVAVSADHDPDAPYSGPPGGTITWRFRNGTPDRLVTDRTYTIALPPSVHGTFLTVMEEGGGVGCDVDPLDRNPSCRLTGTGPMGDTEVTLHVAYDTGGTFAVTATGSQASPEQAPGNESLTHTVEVRTAAADLWLTAEPSADEVAVGETYSYLVRAGNDGPDAATEVRLRDELPDGTELVSARRGWLGWRCPLDGRAYTCDLGTLASGASTFVVVTVRATASGTAASAPTMSARQADSNPASNTAPVLVAVVEPGDESAVDLVLTRIAVRDPVVAGEPFTDLYVIENRSGRTATGVTLRIDDGDAADLDVDSAVFGWFGRSCGSTATATCTIPALDAGATQFVSVTAHGLRPGAIDAAATISADQPDGDPSNDSIAVTGTVVAPG